jgi:hypothetical protein
VYIPGKIWQPCSVLEIKKPKLIGRNSMKSTRRKIFANGVPRSYEGNCWCGAEIAATNKFGNPDQEEIRGAAVAQRKIDEKI